MNKLNVSIISFVLLAIVAIFAIGSSIYSVDAGETAIVTKYGEIVDQKTSGLNFKSPVENVTFFSTREAKVDFGDFDKTSGDVISGLSAYTADQQTATVALTVTYQIHDPEQVYTRYKTTENMINTLLSPKVRQQLEIVFSKYTAQTAIQNRGEFGAALRSGIQDAFKGYPLIITDVQSVINFSKEYEARIEASVNKDVEIRNKERETRIAMEEARAQKARAEGEAAAKLALAEGEAKQKVVQADADAHAIKVKGEAEAANVKAMADALAKNQELVALETAKRWDGKLPTYLPQGTMMPFINLPNMPQAVQK